MKTTPTTILPLLWVLVLTGACEVGAIGDREENGESVLHEVYLDGIDGQRTTLGYYDADSYMFYEKTLVESPHNMLVVETGDEPMVLFPESKVDNHGAIFDINVGYPVFTYVDQSSADPEDWERIDLGSAYLNPEASTQAIDIARKAPGDAPVGECSAVCKKIDPVTLRSGSQGDFKCDIEVRDLKQDGQCFGVYEGWEFPLLGFKPEHHLVGSCNTAGNKKTKYWKVGTLPRPFFVCATRPIDNTNSGVRKPDWRTRDQWTTINTGVSNGDYVKTKLPKL